MAKQKKDKDFIDTIPESIKLLIGALSVIITVTMSASTVYFTLEKRISFNEQRISSIESNVPVTATRLDSRLDNYQMQTNSKIEKLENKMDTKFDELNKKFDELKEIVIRSSR